VLQHRPMHGLFVTAAITIQLEKIGELAAGG
jgi:hypothetical protein